MFGMKRGRKRRSASGGGGKPWGNRLCLWNRCGLECLEERRLLSGSNALDRLDFGNLASEAAHDFDPGVSVNNLPLLGTGTVGASTGLTYRDPITGSAMTFTLAVDPAKQDYFTVKFWGNDAAENVNLDDDNGNELYNLEQAGFPVIYPNRFYYYTYAIPDSMTEGQTSVQLELSISAPGKPVYSVFSGTDPLFQPDSNDATGTSPTVTGQPTLSTLTATQAINILLANREAIYNTGNYYDSELAHQVIVLGAENTGNDTYTWSAPSYGSTTAPPEVVGLDLFTNLDSWMEANPTGTADTWRQQIAYQNAGPGYTAFPDELLTALTSTYLLQPFTDANGNPVTGDGTLDHYHDPSIIARVVAAIDGAGYEQDSDGGFIQQGNSAAANSAWTGLTSSAPAVGIYAGSSAGADRTRRRRLARRRYLFPRLVPHPTDERPHRLADPGNLFEPVVRRESRRRLRAPRHGLGGDALQRDCVLSIGHRRHRNPELFPGDGDVRRRHCPGEAAGRLSQQFLSRQRVDGTAIRRGTPGRDPGEPNFSRHAGHRLRP